MDDEGDDSQNVPSDIDSQVSGTQSHERESSIIDLPILDVVTALLHAPA